MLYGSWKKNKAAGPDRIPIEFYQGCWDIIKGDIIQLKVTFMNRKWISVEPTMASLLFDQK